MCVLTKHSTSFDLLHLFNPFIFNTEIDVEATKVKRIFLDVSSIFFFFFFFFWTSFPIERQLCLSYNLNDIQRAKPFERYFAFFSASFFHPYNQISWFRFHVQRSENKKEKKRKTENQRKRKSYEIFNAFKSRAIVSRIFKNEGKICLEISLVESLFTTANNEEFYRKILHVQFKNFIVHNKK